MRGGGGGGRAESERHGWGKYKIVAMVSFFAGNWIVAENRVLIKFFPNS